MSGHTPGPWLIQQGDEWADGIVTLHGHNEDGTPMYWTVASYNRRRDEAEANARLIAAAPETAAERDRLREVNAELVAALEQIAHRAHKHAVCTQVQYSLGDIARAAIAKATGDAS
jgi:hypothetical protein